MTLRTTTTVGELAVQLPNATRVFEKYEIDLTCSAIGRVRFLRQGQVRFRLVTCAAVRAFDDVLDSAKRQHRNDEEESQEAHPLLYGERSPRTATPAAPCLLGQPHFPAEKVCSNNEHIGLLPVL
jgi:hypothetical protein